MTVIKKGTRARVTVTLKSTPTLCVWHPPLFYLWIYILKHTKRWGGYMFRYKHVSTSECMKS